MKAIDKLQFDMRPRGVEKIQGHPGFYRIRVGAMRIVYYPMSNHRVAVLVIADRKNAYKANSDLETRLKHAG